MMYDMVIVGAGTAGLTAAIYGVRAGKQVLLLEANTYGGQIINTPEIENYPGIKHTSGFEFATGLYEQAMELGAQIKYEKVKNIEDLGRLKKVVTTQQEYLCNAVILATGAKNRPLGLVHESEWIGAGVSYCATCDGAFYKGKEVAVVGGGNTALEDTLFLSNYCSKVYLVHRRDSFRGEKQLLAALKEKENVSFIFNTNITSLVGTDHLEAVELEEKETKKKTILPITGLFVAIGQMPDNIAFANVVELNESGYIEAGEDCKTKTTGIYAAGDCRTKQIRQLTTAAADGAVAALAACQ